MTRLLSTTFRSLKPPITPKSQSLSSESPSNSNWSPAAAVKSESSSSKRLNWSVYLILSTNPPIKTYVGVTTNFSRRLKQHNGELKGGAKASRAGRPWICACIIRGFESKSEACKFEFSWKNLSKKMPRKKKTNEDGDNSWLCLLQHRNAALNKLKASSDCSHLEFDWKLQPF